MAIELATAYISLVPSMRGAGAKIRSELTSSEVTAATRSAGTTLGTGLSGGLMAGIRPAVASFGASLVAAGAGTALLTGLKKTGDAYAIAGREALKFQRLTGASAEDSSRLRVVAQQSGLTADQLSTAFVRLSRTQNTAGGKKALTELGVSLVDASGKTLPLVDQLRQLATGFANTNDAAVRNRSALALFGRSGADLLPLLNKGASGIEAVIQKADTLGLTFNQTDINGIKKYIAAQRDLQLAVQGVQLQIGRTVFPAIAEGLTVAATAATSLGRSFNSLPAPLRTAGVALAAFGGAGSLLFGGGGLLIRGVQLSSSAWGSLGGKIGAVTGSASRFGGVMRGISIGTGVLAAAGILYGIAQGLETATTNAIGFQASLSRLRGGGNPLTELNAQVSALYGSTERLRDASNQTLTTRTLGVFDFNTPTAKIGQYRQAIQDIDRAIRRTAETDPAQAIKLIDTVLQNASDPKGFRGGSRLKSLKTDLGNLRKDLVDINKGNTATASADTFSQTTASTTLLASALGLLKNRLALAGAGFDAAKARADAFATGLANASGFDNMLSSASKLGSSLQSFRQGIRPVNDALGSTATSADLAAQAQTRLSDAVSATTPAMSAQGISLDAISAGADAFAKSLGSGFGGSAVSTALDLGAAYTSFRDTLRQLPAGIDTSGAALGRYGDLQDEGIRNLLKLGSATRDYLTGLVRQGESGSTVRAEAARLNDTYSRQLAVLGLTGDQLQNYLSLLGTTPTQVDTAIRLSEIEKSRFALNAYIGLLQGKIPATVATTVIAQVQSGNLDAASTTLANFAAKNPVQINATVGVDGSSLTKAADTVQFRLPKTIDINKVLTGGYDAKTLAGIDQAQGALAATADVLKTMVENGASLPNVLAQAGTLRAALGDVFTQAGASAATVDQLFNSAGLQDQQITYSFQLAGYQETVGRIQLLNSLLGEGDKPTAGVQRDIAVRIAKGDLQGASDVLSRWVVDSQDGLIQDPLLVALAAPDVSVAANGLKTFRDNAGATAIVLPTRVDMSQATSTVFNWLTGWFSAPPPLPVTADTGPATAGVLGWAARFDVTPLQVAAQVKITNLSDFKLFGDAFKSPPLNVGPIGGSAGILAPPAPNTRRRATGGALDARGGLVPGPRALGDVVPAFTPQGPVLLTGEEYVLRSAAVDRIGIPMLDMLNTATTTIDLGRDKSLRRFAGGGPLTGSWTSPPAPPQASAVPIVAMPMTSVGSSTVGDTTRVEVNNYGPGPLDVADIPAAIRRDRFLRGRRSSQIGADR